MNRHKQFLKVPYGFIDHTMQQLDDTSLRVWIILRSHYNPKTDLCNPSQELIAEKAGRSISSVRKALRTLEHRHFITTERVPFHKNGQTHYQNNYILNYDKEASENQT